jgi:hypothetical protein
MEESVDRKVGIGSVEYNDKTREGLSVVRQAPIEERRRAWVELCCDFESSGQSISRFSSERGCSERQLRYWLCKLGKQSKRPQEEAKPRAREPGGFVELTLPQLSKPARYKITFANGTALELSSDFEVSAVSELIGILQC